MPEYRAIRERHGILDVIKQPELACEVTLQPVNAFDVDAAIIFADILPLLEGMGFTLEFVRGEGPVIHNPIRSTADIERLRTPPAADALAFTLAAIRLARAELAGRRVPLIGFSGAPFTLASYAIEGGPSKNQARTKGLMMGDPPAWHALMSKLTTVVGDYLLAQVAAGAQALQLFDSWCGELSPADYAANVLPYVRETIRIAKVAGVPIILFGVNTGGMLELLKSTGPDVLGIDWRIELGAARERLGAAIAVQGNLDPVALLAPWNATRERARQVLDQAGGQPGHIFNLGHGVLPQTPVVQVKRLVDFVHEATQA